MKTNKINVQNLSEHGFDVVRGSVSNELIDAFYDKYSPAHNLFKSSQSYLPSRCEYLVSAEIQNLLSLELFDNFAKGLNKILVFHLIEARLGSSQIEWHRDLNVPTAQKSSSLSHNYYGAIIALGDIGENAGFFQIVSGSHKVDIDLGVINVENCNANPQNCYDYYHDLLEDEAKNLPVYEFHGQRGDLIFWDGLSIHRGAKDTVPSMEWDTNLTWMRDSFQVHMTLLDPLDTMIPLEKLKYGDNLYLSADCTDK